MGNKGPSSTPPQQPPRTAQEKGGEEKEGIMQQQAVAQHSKTTEWDDSYWSDSQFLEELDKSISTSQIPKIPGRH